MFEIIGIEIFKVLLILVACILIVGVLILVIKKKLNKAVRRTSKRYRMLSIINQKYHFWNDVKKEYIFPKRLKSKQQFDRFNFNNYFNEIIEKDLDIIEDIIIKMKDNQTWLEQYIEEVNNIELIATKEEAKSCGIPLFIFKKIEERIFEEEQLSPNVSPVFLCRVRYTSPKGRNSYKGEAAFSLQELNYHHSIVVDKINARETKEYQRKIMTNSLRYDILRRDNFKCVICGKNAQDDIKLHVDHIIPIAKGGKTVVSNLRTLCEDCNLGKSDKYDEFGDN